MQIELPEMMQRQTSTLESQVALLLVAWVLLSLGGCGRGGPERTIVHGRVTYKGKEVGDGEIFFLPKEGTAGSGGGSRIVRGQYRTDTRGGVIVGDYRVRIEGFELAEGAELPPAVMGVEATRGKPYLPEKYNTNTELELSISQSGTLEHNFNLPK